MRLTLRTLLAYLDDTLGPVETREIGLKVAENPQAQELIDRIKRVTRRRGLATPPASDGATSDPNTVADYLSDTLSPEQVAEFERTCLESDVHLAEVAACHQILTLLLSEQVRVPPIARRRMYQLVKGRESLPNRQPGNTIPVGGAPPDAPATVDDADAPLLLGMSAYSRSDSGAKRAAWAVAVGLLFVGFAIAFWMALPPSDVPRPADVPAFAAVGTQPTPPVISQPVKPKPEPRPPVKPEVSPGPEAPSEPVEVVEPPREAGKLTPDQELAAKVPPPAADRVLIGQVEKPIAVVVRKQPGDDAWGRVLPEEPAAYSTDRLVCLPGFRGTLRLETGVVADLWGNLAPELLPPPNLLEASVTPHAPPGGFQADLTVHSGRIYLTTKRAAGSIVRLRVRDQVWDVALADDKAEVVIEVVHGLMPGGTTEPPQTLAIVAVLSGQATLMQRYKPAVVLPTGGTAHWDSKAGPLVVREKPDETTRKVQAQYLSRVQAYPDADRARAALEAVNDFATRITDAKRVRAVFAESLQERMDAPPTRKDVAAARIAVLAFAAMADVNGLADALTDPRRQLIRQTAVQGLQAALALDQSLMNAFRQALVDKADIGDANADTVMRLLRGLSERDRTDPAVLDRLATGLRSPAVCVRELSFQSLVTFLDPEDREKETLALFGFDPGAPKEFSDPAVKAWEKKVEELKKRMEEPVKK